MKLSLLLLGAFTAVTKVLADENVVEDLPVEPVEPSQEAVLKNYEIEYYIEEHEDVKASDIAQLNLGETVTFHYDIKNTDDIAFTVVGLGGEFFDPLTGNQLVNLTAHSIDPTPVEPGEAGLVRQKIMIDFPARDYVYAPVLYVAYEEQLQAVPVRTQLVTVDEPSVSIFNPQLLFLELLFIGAIGAYVYHYHGKAVKLYFIDAPPAKREQSSGSASGANWLPKQYHAVQKKSKARKAY